MYYSNLLVNGYVSFKFERYSMTNDRVILDQILFLFCLIVTLTFDLRTRKCIQLINKLLSIYQPSLEEIRWKMKEKSQNAGCGKEKKNKKKERKDITTTERATDSVGRP